MSGPNTMLREAEYLDCGFLAAQSQETISKLLGEKPLSESDRQILGAASDFLNKVSDGANLVSTGRSERHNSRASMQALDVAMGPLEVLHDLIRDGEVADFFKGLAEATKKASGGDNSQIEQLENSKRFFQVLYNSTLKTLNNDFPPLGDRSGKLCF